MVDWSRGISVEYVCISGVINYRTPIKTDVTLAIVIRRLSHFLFESNSGTTTVFMFKIKRGENY